MKKSLMQKLFLILLPMSAVGLAAAGDSVTVMDLKAGTMTLGSYFDLIPEAGNLQILPPLAGILAVAAVILGILYMVRGKAGLLKGILWVGGISASVAALPAAIAGEVIVAPNVLLPLLMGGQAALAWFMARKPQGKRIQSRPRG